MRSLLVVVAGSRRCQALSSGRGPCIARHDISGGLVSAIELCQLPHVIIQQSTRNLIDTVTNEYANQQNICAAPAAGEWNVVLTLLCFVSWLHFWRHWQYRTAISASCPTIICWTCKRCSM